MAEQQIMILMRGIPGSGKSTRAEALKQIISSKKRDAVVLSTDDFWYKDDPDIYAWDAKKIGEAHKWNQNRALQHIRFGHNVIIDNTNLDTFAIAPYIDIALKHNVKLYLHTVETPVETCIERQADRPEDRRVPEETIRRMAEKLSKEIDLTQEIEKAKIRNQIRSQLN